MPLAVVRKINIRNTFYGLIIRSALRLNPIIRGFLRLLHTQWQQARALTSQPCERSVSVSCPTSTGIPLPNNLLVTQLINRTVVTTTSSTGLSLPQVSVLIESQAECSNSTDVNCLLGYSYSTYKYETSVVNKTAAASASNYVEVAATTLSSNKLNSTINVNLTTDESSFHLGFQLQAADNGICNLVLLVSRIIVFYTVCPQQTLSLINFPSTVAPMFLIDSNQGALSQEILVDATCMEKAFPESEGVVVKCSSNGTWSLIAGSGCRCAAGYSEEDGACTCK